MSHIILANVHAHFGCCWGMWNGTRCMGCRCCMRATQWRGQAITGTHDKKYLKFKSLAIRSTFIELKIYRRRGLVRESLALKRKRYVCCLQHSTACKDICTHSSTSHMRTLPSLTYLVINVCVFTLCFQHLLFWQRLAIPLSRRNYSQANTRRSIASHCGGCLLLPTTTLRPLDIQIYVFWKTVPLPFLNTTRLRTATAIPVHRIHLRGYCISMGFKSAGHTCVCNF